MSHPAPTVGTASIRTAIIGVSLWALIRRIVTNTPGVIIELGRTQRLFTGHAHDAVMLLEPTCIWPGCDQPHTGATPTTSPAGPPTAPRPPQRRAAVPPPQLPQREGVHHPARHHGHWHITAPDGTAIC